MPSVILGPLSELPPGAKAVYMVEGEPILVLRVDEDELYALHNICSHAYARLSEGEFDPDECTVECPLHGSTFDVRSGIPRTFPAFEPVQTYAVRVEAGRIVLEYSA
jgi:3-phenylpropionate/trans-cinnamate dioxygenase ferredoxin subunit